MMELRDRAGHPLTPVEWARLRTTRRNYYRICEDRLFGVWISTVWIGIEDQFFETMLRYPRPIGDHFVRYDTEVAARLGHCMAVAFVREQRAMRHRINEYKRKHR